LVQDVERGGWKWSASGIQARGIAQGKPDGWRTTARSIAFSAATAAADLEACSPVITTPLTVHLPEAQRHLYEIHTLETVITDLMSGQFNDPVRVVAFSTLEHWAQDVSKDVALEIQSRSDIDGHDVPETLRERGAISWRWRLFVTRAISCPETLSNVRTR